MKSRKGFTLIELLVVIAIIGLLSTLAIVALNSARQKARDSKRVADIKQLQTSLELYFNDNQRYPAALGDEIGITAEMMCLDSAGWKAGSCGGGTLITYMGLTPRDPSQTAAGVACTAAGAVACNYGYNLLTGNLTYNIYFRLEQATGGLLAGPNCGSESGTAATCTH